MKVLILHQHFKIPHRGGAIRSYYLAKALVDHGIETVVITAHNEPVFKTEIIEGIVIHYLPVAYDNRFGFYQRIKSFFKFTVEGVRYAARYKGADLCYAISVPLTIGLAAMWIKRKYRIPFIFEVGDLWPDAPVQMGFIRNPIFKFLLYRLEKSIYKRAESLVALSPAIESALKQKAPGKKIQLLPNMADTSFFKPEPKEVSLEEKFNCRGKFVVSYIGAVGVANGLDYFLACAHESGRVGLSVHFLLCGDGAMLDELKESARKLALKNLDFIPFQNRDGVRQVMNVTDAVFICYKPVKILETGSPNKYFDGLAAGKLIVTNFGGWIREEIEREGCGVYADPGKAENFIEVMKPFVDDAELLKEKQRAARMLGERKYSREKLGGEFCRMVELEGKVD